MINLDFEGRRYIDAIVIEYRGVQIKWTWAGSEYFPALETVAVEKRI